MEINAVKSYKSRLFLMKQPAFAVMPCHCRFLGVLLESTIQLASSQASGAVQDSCLFSSSCNSL